jgi:ADP-ribose pyrophosphatase
VTDPFTPLGSVRLGDGVLNRFERDHLLVGDGSSIRRDRLTHPGAVVLVACEDGGVWFLRQWRPAVGEWVWELPAGLLEPREAPERAAMRECEEEIGRSPRQLSHLGVLLTSPGILAERCHVYRAESLVPVDLRPDGHEEVLAERHLVPMEHLPSRISDGSLRNAISIAALALGGILDPRS